MRDIKESTFFKYHAAGNDFIVLNNLNQQYSNSLSTQEIHLLCHRQLGMGADGLVILQNWNEVSNILSIDLYNSDGGATEMCANGTRCAFALLSKLKQWQDKNISIQTRSGIYQAYASKFDMWLAKPIHEFKSSDFNIKKIPLTFDYSHFYFADSGVPHSVFFVQDVDKLDVNKISPMIRHHEIFPNGCNVNFITQITDNEFKVRTFERGVEAETLSCGTAILSISYILKNHFKSLGEILFHTSGGKLKSKISAESISYGGGVTAVFSGTLDSNFFHASR